MDAITEHHYHNIANGKAYEDEDGKLSTVKTIIVEIDGAETLIPTVWDGKIVDDQTAIRFANDSGIDWPKRTGKDAVERLEAFDEAIHRQFNYIPSPEEAAAILEDTSAGASFSDADKSFITNLAPSFDTPREDDPASGSGLLSKSIRPRARPTEELFSAGSGTTMLMDEEGNFYDEDGAPINPENQEYASKNGFALGGLATARKGIKTQEGLTMAKNKFQLDRKKADLDKDGKLSNYEEAKGEAVQKAMDNDEIPEMAHGGMAGDCGMMSDPMPIGSTDAEVADDITAMISENEYVLPANVVKWHGLKHIMSMHDEAEMGFMMMQDMGLLVEVDGETESDSEGSENAEVSDEGDTEQEETEETIETPQGNEIEVAGVETEYSEPEVEETDEYLASDYGKMSDYGMMKKQRFAFIV
jgi:hypothetical protein